MSQYNKLSDYQYAKFQIMAVHLYFGLFWAAGLYAVMTVLYVALKITIYLYFLFHLFYNVM